MKKLLIFAVLLVAACGGSSDSVTAPSFTVAGTYKLVTADGASVPCCQISSGSFQVKSDNTFHQEVVFTSGSGDWWEGTVETSGTNLTFHQTTQGAVGSPFSSDNPDTFHGTVSGNQLTVTYSGGSTDVYKKQ